LEILLKRGARLWRVLAGEDTRVEHFLRRRYRLARCGMEREIVGEDYILFWSRQGSDRIGVYLKGGCHLHSIFSCKPWIHRGLRGTCCIFNDGDAADSRSDVLLQTLDGIPQDRLNPVTEKLRLRADYFRPSLFEKTFSVPGMRGTEVFTKTVTFISVGPDVVRTAYRHRRYGFLVDPGGWWLSQPMDRVLGNLESANWFRENFESVGRLTVDAFAANYAKIIGLLKKNIAAPVIVFSVPIVEPGKLIHNYGFVREPQAKRNREFYIALAELSRKLDFPIVDVDRVLKKAGIGRQLDFAHFTPEQHEVLAREAFSIARDIGVFRA